MEMVASWSVKNSTTLDAHIIICMVADDRPVMPPPVLFLCSHNKVLSIAYRFFLQVDALMVLYVVEVTLSICTVKSTPHMNYLGTCTPMH